MEVLKSKLVIFLCLPMFFLFVVGSFPIEKNIYGICEKVIDGDTIIVNGLRIRLKGIDAPESSQSSYDGKPIGLWSKKALESLIQDKEIRVSYYSKGVYHRILGTIYLGQLSINEIMLKTGMAVMYMPKNHQHSRSLEYLARLKRLGIFKTMGFDLPGHYRKKNKKRPLL